MDLLNESAWTDPREDCPHPEYWHSPDFDGTEFEVSELVAGFVRALQPEYVVETGTHYGQTAYAIGMALMQNGHGELDTIEIDSETAMIAYGRCTRPIDLPVIVQQMSSLDFTPRMPIGFAWFDSDIDLRLKEFERFRPYLAPGAVCGFHDTGPHKKYSEYGEAIREIPGTVSLQLPTPRGVTFLQVR